MSAKSWFHNLASNVSCSVENNGLWIFRFIFKLPSLGEWSEQTPNPNLLPLNENKESSHSLHLLSSSGMMGNLSKFRLVIISWWWDWPGPWPSQPLGGASLYIPFTLLSIPFSYVLVSDSENKFWWNVSLFLIF